MGDMANDALDRRDEEIDHAYVFGNGTTPEPQSYRQRETQVGLRDSFISTYERQVEPKPPWTGQWRCRACSADFDALSADGYCPADQAHHLSIQQQNKRSQA